MKRSKPLDRRGYQVPPSAWDAWVGPGRTGAEDIASSRRLKAPLAPTGSELVPGRWKPAAALRKPADSSASFAIAAEVALVDSAVCALISFRTCMLRAMFCAAPVC